MSDTEFDFEEQIRLSRLEAEGKLEPSRGEGGKVKIIDGTEYEWDESKRAYFPKLGDDLIAAHHACYGVRQDESGNYTYIDPNSKHKLVWTSEKGWCDSTTNQPFLTSHQTAATTDPNVKFDTNKNCYTYLNPNGTIKYTYNDVSKSWIPFQSGNNSNNNNLSNESKSEFKKPKKKKLKISISNAANKEDQEAAKKPAEWYNISDKKNTNVYVSNLPDDVTLDEFTSFMSKCGIVMEDPLTKKSKIKLYTDVQGNPKGDGRCCYLKIESVNLALQILDGATIRGTEVKVERAKFEQKGTFNPTLTVNKTNQTDKIAKNKALAASIKRQEKLLEWIPDPIPGERFNWEKTVVLHNVFDPVVFDKDPGLIIEYRNKLRTEALKFGLLKKLKLYDRHPDGIATLIYNDFDEADDCIASLEGRMFNGRLINAHSWDGKTKYNVKESEQEMEKRIEKWNEYLEED